MPSVNKYVILTLIGILATTSILLAFENHNQKERLITVKHELPLSQIQWDLVQLEGAIAYQMENQWKQPSHVREKVGDVLQDIIVILQVDNGIRVLTEQEKVHLDRFHMKLSDYPKDNMVEPSNELSQTEIDQLIQLRKALRDVEWGVGFSNSGLWDSFMGKLTKLIPRL